MSPVTAKVKCSHYGGQGNVESEAFEAVASVEDGVGGVNDFERGAYSGPFLPPIPTHSVKSEHR